MLFIALVVATIIVVLSGYSVNDVARGLIGGMTDDFAGALRWATPLILNGLAVAVAFRGGAFNIGGDGQLYLGAIATTFVAIALTPLPRGIVLPLSILAGMVAGAIWAGIAAFLRVRWGANVVVATLLLNYPAYLLTDYLVLGPMAGTGTYRAAESTNIIPEASWLARIMEEAPANSGLFIALALGLILHLLMNRATIGYEIKQSGLGPIFARYGGMPVGRIFLTTMLISGAIAGLSGSIEILGVHRRFPLRFSAGIGFDGIAVSLLGKNNPIGVVLSGLFFGALRNGALSMQRTTEVPRAMAQIVQAVLIFTISAQTFIDFRGGISAIKNYGNRLFKNRRNK
jgi:simple sugar transport system permease protein